MAFFKEEDQKQIRAILEEKISEDITLDLFIKKGSKIVIPGKPAEECPYCEAVVEMFSELNEMHGGIKYNVHELGNDPEKEAQLGINDVPAIVFNGKSKGRMVFYGIPSGYEFASLLEVLGSVSSDTSPAFSPDMVSFLESYDKPADIKVFVTPTCPYCPSAAVSALLAARLNDKISAEVYEVSEFPKKGDEYKVEGVPKTVINGSIEITGGYPEKTLREKLEEI